MATPVMNTLLLLGLLGCSVCQAGLDTLFIFFTADLHGHMKRTPEYAGAARIGAFFKDAKARRRDVLVLDAGDAVSGTPISDFFGGTPVFQIMSEMGYDAGILGNHEFDLGWRKIRQYREAAVFPLLSANAFSPLDSALGDAPFAVFRINNLNVGVLGVLSDSTQEMTSVRKNRGVRFSPPVEVIRLYLPEMKKHADLIVLLSHLGLRRDRRLARAVNDLDLIIGGHSNESLKKPEKIGRTRLVQIRPYGREVGALKLLVDTEADSIFQVKFMTIEPDRLPLPDSAVDSLVGAWDARLADTLDQVIGVSAKTRDKFQVKVMIENVLKKEGGGDLGFYNLKGIRAGLPAGNITHRHLWRIEPFGNRIVKVTLNVSEIGGELKKQLEKLCVRLKPERRYVVVTNSFVLEHSLRYLGKSGLTGEDTGILVRDALANHIRKDKRFRKKPVR